LKICIGGKPPPKMSEREKINKQLDDLDRELEFYKSNLSDKEECEECAQRRWPAGEYCQGCDLREYRK